MTMFAIIVTGKEARAFDDTVMSPEGERYWVEMEESGWVVATSSRVRQYPKASAKLKTFDTREKAEEFAKSWTGHPWWCIPKSYEIVEVEPLYEWITGFKVVTPG